MEEKNYWLVWSNSGASSKEILENFQRFGSLENAWKLSAPESRESPEEIRKKLQVKNIQTITWLEPDYPKYLKEIYNPPAVLYIIGRKELLYKPNLAVVGTRRPSTYGLRVVRNLVGPVSKTGVVIISGMAYGIDSAAQLEAIENHGNTIGVCAFGFDHFPYSRINFFKTIRTNGTIISEYPPSRPAEKFTFVERNRIIAGLSPATLIIEARKKSGALITAKLALSENREVFAIPGPIDQETSLGVNNLLKNHEAQAVTEPEDILNFYGFKNTPENRQDISELELSIINILAEPLSAEIISTKIGQNLSKILAALSFLEVKRVIKKNLDNTFSRI